jgi:hypothetical protein
MIEMDRLKSIIKSPVTALVSITIILLALMFAGTKIQNDNVGQQIANMQFTGILSIITVIIFGLISEIYIKDNPEIYINYLQFLVYLAIFFSLTSFSMCTIAPVSKEPSTDKTLWDLPVSGLQWWGIISGSICLLLALFIYIFIELDQHMLKYLTYLSLVLSLLSLTISTEHKLRS